MCPLTFVLELEVLQLTALPLFFLSGHVNITDYALLYLRVSDGVGFNFVKP